MKRVLKIKVFSLGFLLATFFVGCGGTSINNGVSEDSKYVQLEKLCNRINGTYEKIDSYDSIKKYGFKRDTEATCKTRDYGNFTYNPRYTDSEQRLARFAEKVKLIEEKLKTEKIRQEAERKQIAESRQLSEGKNLKEMCAFLGASGIGVGDGYCSFGMARRNTKNSYHFDNPTDVAELIEMEKEDLDKLKKEYANKFTSLKEYCQHLSSSYGALHGISWSEEKKECSFDGWISAKYEYNALKEFVINNSNKVIQLRKDEFNAQKKAKEDAFSEFNKIRAEERVYANLVMDSSLEYNKDAIKKIKDNNNKIAGLDVSYKENKFGLIERITLKSPTKNIMQAYLSLLYGKKAEDTWTLEEIDNVVNKIKSKYKMIDSKKDIQEHDLNTVRDAILGYHNRRTNRSQADYNIDDRNAQSIKNQKETFLFENKGDKIIVTVKTSLKGDKNTNMELLNNDVYQNSVSIEYISKKVVEQEEKAEQEKLDKVQKNKQRKSNELGNL